MKIGAGDGIGLSAIVHEAAITVTGMVDCGSAGYQFESCCG